jgi:hypothetical protein
VYLAHCYPYTYTQLCKYLNTIERDSLLSKRFKRRILCQTIAGNKHFLLII